VVKLQEELTKRVNITPEKFKQYQSPEQMAETIETVRQEEAEKYRNFIDPNDQPAIQQAAVQLGYRFTSTDIGKAVREVIEKKNQEYKDYQSPAVVEEREEEVQQKLAKVAEKVREVEQERDRVIQERDKRANITNSEHKRLLDEKKQVEDNLAG